MVNVEDAIKVAGLEGKMSVVDLTEVVDQHMVREVREKDVTTEKLELTNIGG